VGVLRKPFGGSILCCLQTAFNARESGDIATTSMGSCFMCRVNLKSNGSDRCLVGNNAAVRTQSQVSRLQKTKEFRTRSSACPTKIDRPASCPAGAQLAVPPWLSWDCGTKFEPRHLGCYTEREGWFGRATPSQSETWHGP